MASVACLGMAVWDRILSVPHLPQGPTKLYAQAFAETGGGPAATASTAIARLGGSAQLIARVGDDAVGALISEELARYGVGLDGFRRLTEARSAWSSVAIDPKGERLIVNFPGTGLDVAPDWITTELLAGSGALLVDMGWRRGAEAAMQLARRLSIPIVLDADLTPDPQTVSLIGLADHVLFSSQALSKLTGVQDPEQALLKARETAHHAEVIGVTLGERGCVLLKEGQFVTVPGFAVDVVDTLGAGDVFHGAYALAIAEGMPFISATRFANAAAAMKCTRHGGRAGIPTRVEVEKFLAEIGAFSEL